MPSLYKILLFSALLLDSGPMRAASIYTSYDIRSMLSEPHPFQSKTRIPNHKQNIKNKIKLAKPELKTFKKNKKTKTPSNNTFLIKGSKSPTSDKTKTHDKIKTAEKTNHNTNLKTGILGNLISQVSTGILIHDEGPFSRKKESGADLHFEMRFVSPEFLDFMWSPSPHIGANINSSGDTSQFFSGVSYEWDFWSKRAFAGFSLGFAVHTGNKNEDDPDRKDLGCTLLFRESINIGYHLNAYHDVSLLLDHISNAKICSTNEGLENFGVRYSYRF